ncbi:MAG TPA: 30S ribosomal protein S3 [Gemmatales bacterium]|nr:30S ribosomal protein S3 [Lacipirellulaceae bacterium]HMP60065.1 30S ribosomal protein S3 [Gemmatales bacterium]
MGQKIRPIGFRVGVMEDWRSRWYANKQEFADLLVEDFQIRKFINKRYKRAGIPRIEIERTRDEVKVLLYTSRPGGIIGRKGQEVETLTAKLEKLTGRRINLKIEKVDNPQLSAQLVAEDIAEQLEKRSSFRRTMKKALDATMEAGARGIKISLSGRLGGAEMSRHEKAVLGRVPLTTLRARIDYGFTEAWIAQGHIGIKVWINNGDYLEEASRAPNAQTGKVSKKPTRSRSRPSNAG